MLGIHNQPSVMTSSVPFKGKVSDIKRNIEDEGQEQIDQFEKDQADWNEFADNLENSDNKVAKKAGKIVRVGAALLGIAATFVGAKVGAKVAVETIKTLGNSGTGKSIIDGVKKMKEPVSKTFSTIVEQAKKMVKTPTAQKIIDRAEKSKIGQTVINTLKNEKVAKAMEPLKKTFDSIKNIKVDGKKVQSFIENAMAITTTGSVVVDDLAGRNNDKSTAELAAGV